MDGHKDDERRSRRSRVLLGGVIESKGVRARVRIADLSAHGALVIVKTALAKEAEVTLRCNGIVVRGWVAWVQAPHAGIQFVETITPGELLGKEAAPQLVIPDTRSVDFRRPGFRGNQLTPEQKMIVEEWTQPRRAGAGD